jgi:hypothetical protein
MRFEYSLTLEDFMAAHELNSRQSLGSKIRYSFAKWGSVFIFIFMALLIGAYWDYSHELRRQILDREWWLVGVLALAFLLIVSPSRYSRLMEKRFNVRFPAEHRRNWIDISDLEVSSAIVGTEAGRFPWSLIVRFAQDEKITLVYLTKNRFLYFPTSVMNQFQRTELNELVARNMVRR